MTKNDLARELAVSKKLSLFTNINAYAREERKL